MDVGRLIQLTRQKYQCLEKIKEFTENQTEVLALEDIDALSKLIQAKQRIIDLINRLDQDFEESFSELKKTFGITSLEEMSKTQIPGIKELQSWIEKIMSLVKIIVAMEKENNKKVKENLDNLGDKLKGLGTGKKAARAYYPKPFQMPSYYFDKKK